jgi:hypothetical protein
MKVRYLVLAGAVSLLAANAPGQSVAPGTSQSTAPVWASARQPASKRTLEQEVALLRQRVMALELRVAQLEGQLGARPNAEAKPLGRVGQIVVIGNTETCQAVILGALPFKPGDRISYADLQLAVRRLELLDIFVVNPEKSIRPQVAMMDGEVPSTSPNQLRDILVQVQERTQLREQR